MVTRRNSTAVSGSIPEPEPALKNHKTKDMRKATWYFIAGTVGVVVIILFAEVVYNLTATGPIYAFGDHGKTELAHPYGFTLIVGSFVSIGGLILAILSEAGAMDVN